MRERAGAAPHRPSASHASGRRAAPAFPLERNGACPMGHFESPMDRRRFLTAAALTTGAAVLPGVLAGRASAAVPPQATLPDRGMYDTTTASAWTDGFVTGNGQYGPIL